MKKSEENKQRTKFKFGRNPLSLIIVVLSLAIIFFVSYTIYSYASTWNKNTVTPFVTQKNTESSETDSYKNTSPITLEQESDNYKIIRMNGKDFNLFDLTVECTEYGQQTNGYGQFKATLKWNENTSNKAKVLKDLDNSQHNIQLAFCLASDWVGFCKYATSMANNKITSTSDAITASKSVEGLKSFPITANTFPVPVKVYTPDLYVLIRFQYEDNGVKTENYILKYTYDEYHIDGKTIGGYTK